MRGSLPIVAWLSAVALVSPVLAESDSDAGSALDIMRASGEGYRTALPGQPIGFPQDHLAHPDYRIEWWYLTANLIDTEGQPYGVHWTLFRTALRPVDSVVGWWRSNQMWMAHSAVHTPTGHHYEERFARGGIGQAGVGLAEAGQFNAWLDDWQLLGTSDAPVPGHLSTTVNGLAIELDWQADQPWVLHGDNGFSQKSGQGQGSYYYSQPRLQITGELTIDGTAVPVSGEGWLDREWSSQPLARDQQGWDWFSLQFDDGTSLMAFHLRQKDAEPYVRGTWIDADGQSRSLNEGDLVIEPLEWGEVVVDPGEGTRKSLPLRWRIELPSQNARWTVRARQADSWLATLVPYWEGPVRVEGSSGGVGYLEMTGY
ncbi:lipocalin-like domain-containing protein [Saccharospirillum impatiens]|uniref:lipocalin-like domain-containing protein n=1 Tax=Saccharospirillum impatiens TaxID=169438 RepID=UPI000405624A|nr:lipocalin-like domain-containing protein [Saccharospirillum impatiens]